MPEAKKPIAVALFVHSSTVVARPAGASWSRRLRGQNVGAASGSEWLGLLSFFVLLLVLAAPARAADVQPEMAGDLRIHDPSVIEVGGRYIAFGTGEQGLTRGAIRLKTSTDGVRWFDAGAIGKGTPKWATRGARLSADQRLGAVDKSAW